MESLKQKIITEGTAIGKDIVKVDGFLNHQLDIRFLEEIGAEFGRRFADVQVDRILTVESSGIVIAAAAAPHFGYPPVVFAKKAAPNTMTEGFYEEEARSFTKGTVSRLCVSEKFLHAGESVLIIDDFLAYGEASLALAEMVRKAGATVAGIGIVIEKGFQGGSEKLRARGLRVESLAVIEKIEDGVITFAQAPGASAVKRTDCLPPLQPGKKVDYHIHTTYSDGASTPAQIVRQAKQLGYDAIAITDHDNTAGLPEAMAAARAEGLQVIPGLEIATQTEEGIGLHILGYGIDPDDAALQDFLADMIRQRERRNEKLFAELAEMGYPLDKADLKTGANSFIGKPIIARAMVEKGYIQEAKEAFGPQILGSARCRAIKKVKPSAGQAIQVILQAGGCPVLAHPIQTRGIGETGSEDFFENIETIIARLKDQGLEGLEGYHPDQDEEASARFVRLAEQYGLFLTRGSDFHGSDFAKAQPTAEAR